MSVFPDWQKFLSVQRRAASGCIPTGYETLLRAAGTTEIDLETFQDEFDFDKDLEVGQLPKNNFDSVSQAVQLKYPQIIFKRIVFSKGEGHKKIQFIEDSIGQKRLVLISLNMEPVVGQAGWHIMPVVDMDDENLFLVYSYQSEQNLQLISLEKNRIIYIHEAYEGGDDVAYLEL